MDVLIKTIAIVREVVENNAAGGKPMVRVVLVIPVAVFISSDAFTTDTVVLRL